MLKSLTASLLSLVLSYGSGMRKSVPLTDGPMWTAGDAALIPDGYSRLKKNLHQRPGNRWDKRAPWVYDGVVSTATFGSFCAWQDTTNNVLRLLLPDVGTGPANAINVKSATVDTWAATAVSVDNSTSFGDSTSYRGQAYILGVPTAGDGYWGTPRAWNGTVLTPTSAGYDPFSPDSSRSGIGQLLARSICIYKERLILGAGHAFGTNAVGGGSSASSYDLSSALATWVIKNVTVEIVGTGSGKYCRLTPQYNGVIPGQQAKVELNDVASFGLVTFDQFGHYLTMLRGVSPTDRMPMTAEVYVSGRWAANTAYEVGQLITPRSLTNPLRGNRWRCKVAGTSATPASAEPAWATTAGFTVVDGGTLTWVYDGLDTVGAIDINVPNATEVQAPLSYFVDVTFPGTTAGTQSTLVGIRLKFGNSSAATWPLSPVDVSFRDGLTDGDPTKANWGQQFAYGQYHLPFFNRESSSSIDQDIADVLYTAPGTNQIRTTNTINIPEVSGRVTVVREVGGRLVIGKRSGFGVFNGTGDPDIPFSHETTNTEVGPIHWAAFDTFEGKAYFIGENEIYKWSVGGDPEPICGPGMREEIMNKSASTWVESQSVYKIPILAIDKKNRDVYVYTQKAKYYVFHLGGDGTSAGWSTHTIQGLPHGADTATGLQIRDFAYHPTTGNMYAVVQGKTGVEGEEVRRLDITRTQEDDGDSAGTETYSIVCDSQLKPIELMGPRFDATLESVGLYHASGDQSADGLALVPYYSYDQGANWTALTQVSLRSTGTPGVAGTTLRDPLQYYITAPSIMIRFTHNIEGGPGAFTYSRVDADLNIRRGEYPLANPL